MAKWFLIAGVFLVLIGLALQFAPWLLSWFGRLPGDIRFETGNTRVFIPITSMIILSVILSILFNVFRH